MLKMSESDTQVPLAAGKSFRPLKIAHVVPTYFPAHIYGGPIQSVYHLCRGITRAGCEVRVLTTDANGDARLCVDSNHEQELADGVRVFYCRRDLKPDLSCQFLARLPGVIRWADVVHLTAVYSFPTIPTLAVANLMRKPVVWSPRGSLQRWKGSTRVHLKKVFEGACRLVSSQRTVLHVTSTEEARESLEKLPGLRSALVPNGVAVPETVFHAPRRGPLRLLFLGRLHQKKGIENLFEACKLLDSMGVSWTLKVVGAGDPAYTQSLHERAAALGLGSRVEMTGQLVGEEKRRVFENSDLAVFPSFTENFGMVIAEALAHGVPVIASKGTPWQEVERKGCGLWVNNDPQTVASAIASFMHAPLDELGRRGRDWMLREFSWDSMGKRMSEIYSQVAQV